VGCKIASLSWLWPHALELRFFGARPWPSCRELPSDSSHLPHPLLVSHVDAGADLPAPTIALAAALPGRTSPALAVPAGVNASVAGLRHRSTARARRRRRRGRWSPARPPAHTEISCAQIEDGPQAGPWTPPPSSTESCTGGLQADFLCFPHSGRSAGDELTAGGWWRGRELRGGSRHGCGRGHEPLLGRDEEREAGGGVPVAAAHELPFSPSAAFFKKAYELFVLCDARVGLIVFSPAGRLYKFASAGSR
jgi:hypothetical protein